MPVALLFTLAILAVDRWVAVGTGSVKGLKATARACGPGRYVNLGRAGCWVGLDHESWARYGRSPIWLRFGSTEWGRATAAARALTDWIRATPPRAYWEGPGKPLLVPALLPAGGSREAAVTQIVDLIREIESRFEVSGITPLTTTEGV